MKNLYLLPTDQPTGIFETNSGLQFSLMNKVRHGEFKGFHIYVTSDEKIKKGDWIENNGKIYKCTATDNFYLTVYEKNKYAGSFDTYTCKKIILSTDSTLIEDGVQAIDDEFLEWFVKNSSCEFINVEKEELKSIYNDFTTEGNGIYLTPKNTPLQTNETLIEDNIISYKIIIPQEEPKQEFLLFDKERANTITSEGQKTVRELQNTIQQETLEEAAETEIYKTINEIISGGKDLIKGHVVSRGHAIDYAFDIALKIAKWQANRMYSEEEVYELLCQFFDDHVNAQDANIAQWFEQNKKK
jgi:hypothetical protein